MTIELILVDGAVIQLESVAWWRIHTCKEESCDVEVKTWGNSPAITRGVAMVKDHGDMMDSAHVDMGFFEKYVRDLRDY